jgi:hypothetical protein
MLAYGLFCGGDTTEINPIHQCLLPRQRSAQLSRLGPFIITKVLITVGVARVHTPVGFDDECG